MGLEVHAALARYAFGAARTVVVPVEGSFDVPSGGRCEPDAESGFLRCRYAVYNPPGNLVSLEVQTDPCTVQADKVLLRRRTDGATPAALIVDLDPVFLRDIPLDKEVTSDDGSRPELVQRFLCPGAHASFAEQRFVSREQLVMTAPSVNLSDYVVHAHSLTVPFHHQPGSAPQP